jgi:hypothetical protein
MRRVPGGPQPSRIGPAFEKASFALDCRLTLGAQGLAYKHHLRSNSGSSGPIAKESHRFLVAGPFNLPISLTVRDGGDA